jgi:hypothetical protein
VAGFGELLKVGFEFGEVGRFAKFHPGPRVAAERDRVGLPDFSRQGFKLVRDSRRLVRSSKIERRLMQGPQL